MAVVLGYDESPGAERALSASIEVASAFGEPLVIVYAIGPPGVVGEEYASHREALLALGRTAVTRAVEAAHDAGVPTTVELVDAKPSQALLDVADKHDARVIVVGTWGESPIKGAMLGSTPHKLLHLSARPILCVPAAE
ncbi:universal stress protein [Aeromicrobium sp.]|uniref:universal stress protein n=1 Tax=Aeromicrobium sp. TaxID=1871063 RepID=UPI0030C1D33F